MNESQENLSTPVEDLLKQAVSEEKIKEDLPKDKNNKKKTEHKKLKHGFMSTAFTVVFIAVIVLVNVVATALFDRYPITLDLTENNVFSISEESEEYVKKIDMDVLITVFAKEDDFTNLATYTRQADEVMKTYCKYNNHISYRYVDIDSNPDVMKNYSGDSISQYDIIVETNPTKDVQRTRKLTLIDLVKFTDEFNENVAQYGVTVEQMAEQSGSALNFLGYYGGYVEASNADQAFTSAFMTVTDPDPVVVTLLTGRDEIADLSYFQTLLTANGYTVNSVDIGTEEIPEDTDIAVIPAPKTDYLSEELKKLDDFLDNDGQMSKQLIYVASVQQEETPNIDEFLADYGIEVGDGVICETYSSNYYSQPFQTISSELSDKFMQDVTTSDPKLLIFASRPVNLLFDEKGKIATEAYVKSTSDAFVRALQTSNGQKQYDETSETLAKGQQNYVAVSSRVSFKDDAEALYSNVIVLGSEQILGNTYLQYNQYQNREYMLSLLNGITHKTDGVVIEPKVIEGNLFDLTDSQKNVLKWTFILIIPVIVLVVGTVIWLRRKNR
ncbi:MAG: GldG family protein [Ruminococcus sp.]|nr:GldG family protein [Ruminococcus sp.]